MLQFEMMDSTPRVYSVSFPWLNLRLLPVRKTFHQVTKILGHGLTIWVSMAKASIRISSHHKPMHQELKSENLLEQCEILAFQCKRIKTHSMVVSKPWMEGFDPRDRKAAETPTAL